jgi:hypothetical protein
LLKIGPHRCKERTRDVFLTGGYATIATEIHPCGVL